MIGAADILNALIALSDDKIWATELALLSGGRRVDFWTLHPTASQQYRASAYEIKISRADFQRDSEEKQEGALKWCDRFWYVTPPSLLSRADLPDWAGLQEWNGKLFSVIKRAPKREKALPDWEFVVSLMRNCGEMRRDTGLMKAQLAFFQMHHERERTTRDIRGSISFERWKRAAALKARAQASNPERT